MSSSNKQPHCSFSFLEKSDKCRRFGVDSDSAELQQQDAAGREDEEEENAIDDDDDAATDDKTEAAADGGGISTANLNPTASASLCFLANVYCFQFSLNWPLPSAWARKKAGRTRISYSILLILVPSGKVCHKYPNANQKQALKFFNYVHIYYLTLLKYTLARERGDI